MSTALVIAPNTLNHESHVAGNSPLGPFTYRGLWADDPGSQILRQLRQRFRPELSNLWPAGGCFASRTEVS
jgi:hypothetical protein